MHFATTTTNTETGGLPFEQRRQPASGRGASDWLDEVTADACCARALTILVQAIARDGNHHALTTARHLQQALGEG
jgi:hypothetical protein